MTASEVVLLRMLGQAVDLDTMSTILQSYVQGFGSLGEEAADLVNRLVAKRKRKWARITNDGGQQERRAPR